MLVSAIVAVGHNNVIGNGNQIPWYLPADLKYFKRTTLGHCVIMGRKSFRSIGRPLPKRTNIVVTRDPFFTADGIVVVHSIEEALSYAFDQGETEAFIIGGGELYRQTQNVWDRLYLTEVDVDVPGEVYFPKIDMTEWREKWAEPHVADEKNEHNYVFKLYERVLVEEESRPGPAAE
jgi:dihydrofolate reductase